MAPDRPTDPPPTHSGPPRLLVSGLSKAFGRQRVLSDVGMQVRRGELHGLVGQNGSGKSTLVKILTGIHAAEPGARIEVDGIALGNSVSVSAMRAAGVSVVHQTLGLIEDGTVLENVRAGRFRGSRWLRRIDWATEREHVTSALRRLDCDVSPDALVETLSAEDRATVAIARALQDHEPGRGLIIFDESTRALTAGSLARFYEQVEVVRRAGAAVLLISHRLEEVLHAADRVTVLRDGVTTGNGVPASELTEASLIKLMIGRELRRPHPSGGRTQGSASAEPGSPAQVGMAVRGLIGDVATDIGFDVGAGEVLGLTGLVGSGFEEVPYLLSGARRARGGEVTVGESRLLPASTPLRAFLDAGIALVPEARDREGLALDLTVIENLTVPRVRIRGGTLWNGRDWQEQELQEMIQRLGIRPARGDVPVATLSGGNQQKVLLGKWLASRPRVLLLHEPTQGVDVGAHEDIAEVIAATAAAGCAVVLASTDAHELAAVCHRVICFRDGRIHGELTGDFSEDEIVEATFAGARELLATQGKLTRTSSPSILTG